MITCHKDNLIARCKERGYSLDAVLPCVVSRDGDTWTVDEQHPRYPRSRAGTHEYSTPSVVGEVSIYRCLHCGKGVASKAPPIPEQCPARSRPLAPSKPSQGAGAELKKLLSRIGITATPTCSCNRRARTMVENGIQWCKDNADLIAGEWLAEESKKRGLPYSVFAGKKLVQLAIYLAERKAAKAGN